ncbi:MAG: CBS domain-containing protein, partial [Bacilli bacterium]|nr:CBS domain-containing protein [Bacilli bacterium]
ANEDVNIRELMSEPVFVTGSMGISEILENMQKTKNHIVIVKDEYGGTDGILTMEDILEELVGDMWDELDEVQEPIKKLGRTMYEVDGMMNIDDFFAHFEMEPPEDADYDTVGGFILDRLERFAKIGDKVNYDRLRIEVSNVDDFSVVKALVKVGRKKHV